MPKHIDDYPDGIILSEPGSKHAFFGGTPVAYTGPIPVVTTTAAVTSSGIFGFATSAQANGIINAVALMIAKINGQKL